MNKGFTLIELLAVIVVLGIILVIAIPNIVKIIEQARIDAYIKDEAMLVNATQKYLVSNIDKVPSGIGDISIVELSDLQSNDILSEIIDSKSDNNCEGKVVVSKKADNKYTYNPYLDCGTNYKTYGDYITNGLVLYLDGYDAPVDDYWADRSGNNNNAQLINMAMTSTSGYDPNKKAYAFDGNNDSMRILNMGNAFSNISFTVSVIVRFNNEISGDRPILSIGVNGANTLLHILSRYMKPYFAFYSNDLTGVVILSKDNVYSLTFKYNISELKKYIYFFNNIDNMQSNSNPLSLLSTDTLYLGYYASSYLNGNIYSIKIYNRALSEDEIKYNYNIDKNRYGL